MIARPRRLRPSIATVPWPPSSSRAEHRPRDDRAGTRACRSAAAQGPDNSANFEGGQHRSFANRDVGDRRGAAAAVRGVADAAIVRVFASLLATTMRGAGPS